MDDKEVETEAGCRGSPSARPPYPGSLCHLCSSWPRVWWAPFSDEAWPHHPCRWARPWLQATSRPVPRTRGDHTESQADLDCYESTGAHPLTGLPRWSRRVCLCMRLAAPPMPRPWPLCLLTRPANCQPAEYLGGYMW